MPPAIYMSMEHKGAEVSNMDSDQELMALAEAFEKDPTVLGVPGETLTGGAARAYAAKLFPELVEHPDLPR